MPPTSPRVYLIVNADDYGYFHCVSRGILQAATQGIVTATGVLATATHFQEHARWLRECATLDVGVHLNLTTGVPLTRDLGKSLSRWSGRLPGKFSVAKAILAGTIRSEDVRAEWRAQIERVAACGLRVRFLNSHEHIHMLPSLYPVIRELASEYDIGHIRMPRSRASWRSLSSLFRSAVLKPLEAFHRRNIDMATADFLGLEVSGKLDIPYLERTIPQLRSGRVYELMCHPGFLDPNEVRDRRLLRYHDWESELRTLTDPTVRDLLDRHAVRPIGYRQLEDLDNRLVVRSEAAQS